MCAKALLYLWQYISIVWKKWFARYVKPSNFIAVVGVLLLELGACEKLKYGGHNVDSGEQNYLSTGGRIRSNLHGPLSNNLNKKRGFHKDYYQKATIHNSATDWLCPLIWVWCRNYWGWWKISYYKYWRTRHKSWETVLCKSFSWWTLALWSGNGR